ncbi:MAG: stage VI sporulation protein F [Bacilli bacterium]
MPNGFGDTFFDRVEKKTNIDKDTIVSLAHKLQEGNFKDENTLKSIIKEISNMTGKDVSEEKEKKIIDAVINDQVPKNMDKYI